MPVDDEGREEPRSRLEAQIDLILSGIPDVVDPLEEAEVWPPNWRERGSFDYLYRRRTLLVRDADVDRVIVGQRDEAPLVLATPDQHDNNLRGLTRLRFSGEEGKTVQEACDLVDRALGEGTVTPDHAFYLCPAGACPATEPEEVPADAPPDPGVSTEPCDGSGVRMAVLDSGWQEGAASHGIAFGLRVEGAADTLVLPQDLLLCVYRISQEALTNVARHAGAQHAWLALRVVPTDGGGLVEWSVQDDGRGLAADALQRGNGLLGIRDRLWALGGEFDWVGGEGGGLVLRARLSWTAEPVA